MQKLINKLKGIIQELLEQKRCTAFHNYPIN